VLARIDTNRFERAQVTLLRVARVWLEDDLELVMLLQPIGVFTIASIIGAYRRLNIANVPGFRPENTQESSRVVGACTHLAVVRLPDQAALLGPESLQGQDHRLEI
jgi:hypothetical protein